ncbi:MAG: class I SAM-dependent methyltransferase [Nitrospinota bacterium]|nr:class I SAM-dependent methyltransferase [Nitrospinota bacterium]
MAAYTMQVLESIEKFYSSEKIVKFYTEKSLFPIEEMVFKKYLNRKGTILDLCCGAGRASFPLSERGFEVIGVDINEKLIKAAREKGKDHPNAHFILSDVEKAQLPENYFDYILVLHNSLEFIPTKKKRNIIFRKLYQYLKKDGLLITTFHSAYFPFHVVGKLIINNIKRQVAATEWSYHSGQNNEKVFLSNSIGNNLSSEMEYNDFFYEKDGLFYHVFTPREIYRSFTGKGFKLHAVHGSRELLARDNPVKKFLGKLLIPFDYTFWVFKKK